MTRTGRGSTRPGVRAALPDRAYAPQPVRQAEDSGRWVVEFEGEDGRRRTFNFTDCALPGWHAALAPALAERIGPAGGLRTSASSLAAWNNLRWFLRFLEALPDPPQRPADVRLRHVAAYLQAQVGRLGSVYGCRAADHVWRVLRLQPVAGQIDAEVLNALRVRTRAARAGTSGYSDGELRRLLQAARADTAQIRRRLRTTEKLIMRWREQPAVLTSAERQEAARLTAVAGHGLPAPDGGAGNRYRDRQRLAEPLFVTRRDVAPLLVLLVAVTGWNIETIKELPAQHQVLDGRAVQLQVTKRRRGPGKWSQAVTWEIGPPGRELHNPGGLYLLLHELMARGRRLSADPASFWAVWRLLRRNPLATVDEIGNPFRAALTAGIDMRQWVGVHGLRGDNGEPLAIDFKRLRTTVEVHRVRAVGGHLPSAARSNTVAVLFSNYLRGDAAARNWAQDVTSSAIADAEQAALQAYRRQSGASGRPTVTSAVEAEPAAGLAPAEAGVWSDCRDSSAHPRTGQRCRMSFLDCFHCANCLVTAEHLPRLLALLDAFEQHRQQLPEAVWWQRYGPAWAAIRTDVLPRFTPAQLVRARDEPPPPAMLDLVEEPWERP